MRYTKPVRFIYSGNRHAAMGLRNQARTLIGKTLKSPVGDYLGRKQHSGRFKFSDGTQITVQKSFGVINCVIHVPPRLDVEEKILKGFIIYYDIGRLYPEENNYRDGFLPWEQDHFDHWPRYRKYGLHSFKPPYADASGNQIIDASENIGTIHEEAYDVDVSPWPPGHPILLESKETDFLEPMKWKGYRFGKDTHNTDYEPSSPLVNWEGLISEVDDYWEDNTEHTTVWKSPPSYPKSFTVWWKYSDGGDMHYIDGEGVDWGDFVYVNGVKFLVPHQEDEISGKIGGVRSAAVQWDEATNTYWLVVTQFPEYRNGWYILSSERNIEVFALQLTTGMKQDKDFVQSNNFFLPSDVEATPESAEYHSEQWFTMPNADNGIHIPVIATNEALWETNDDQDWYFWDALGFKFNSTGTKFAITNYIELGYATEVNEFNVAVTPVAHIYEDKTYYIPEITHSTNYTDYGTHLRSNIVYTGAWFDLATGPITLGITYVNDVRTPITQVAQARLLYTASEARFAEVEHKTTIAAGATSYVRNSKRLVTEVFDDPGYTWTTTLLHHDGVNPVHWDVAENDVVLETISLDATGFPPAETSTAATYTKTITIAGTLVSTDSGNWTRVTNTAYNDPPEGVPETWAYGVDRLDLEFGWKWSTEDGVASYGLNQDVVDTKTSWWMYHPIPTGSLSVHRGDEAGRVIANYIPRSVNARDQGFYLVENPDADKNPWNWLTDQKLLITGGDDVLNLLKVKTDTHTYNNSIKPIVRVHYYGSKPIRIELE